MVPLVLMHVLILELILEDFQKLFCAVDAAEGFLLAGSCTPGEEDARRLCS